MAGCKCYILEELKPIIAMVVCQILGGGAGIVYKLALADGMKVKIMVFYRLIFATAFITPLAWILERNKRPKLTWKIILQGFLSGLLGAAFSANFFGESLRVTSATYAAAMTNLIPAVTFIMAIIFRLESFDLRTSGGKAKILGTVLSITGAMVLTFFKGIKIPNSSTQINLLHQQGLGTGQKNQVLGCLLALMSCFSYASWLIVQARIKYPTYSSIALMSIMGSIQTGIYVLCTESADWSSWKLPWNIRLFTATYSGIVSSGIATVMTASCAMMKGPLFVSSFSPLGPLFIAIVGSLFLNELLHVGSITGSILVISGLYIVLWGKGKEVKANQELLSRNEHLGIGFSVGIQAIAKQSLYVQNSDNPANKQSLADEV